MNWILDLLCFYFKNVLAQSYLIVSSTPVFISSKFKIFHVIYGIHILWFVTTIYLLHIFIRKVYTITNNENLARRTKFNTQ